MNNVPDPIPMSETTDEQLDRIEAETAEVEAALEELKREAAEL